MLNEYSFLKKKRNQTIFTLRSASENLFSDPNISLIKLRQAVEFFVEYLCNKNQFEKAEDLFQSINFLSRKNIINYETNKIFHEIRILGNKAAHEGYYNIEKTEKLIHNCFELIQNENIPSKNNNEEGLATYYSEGNIEENIFNLLIKIFEANSLKVFDRNVMKEDDSNNTIICKFTLSTRLSSEKDYQLFFRISHNEIEIISSPIIENILEFEMHFFINLVNHLNRLTFNNTFYIHSNAVYAKTINNFKKTVELNVLIFDIFHSTTNLVSDIREFNNFLISKKEGNV